MSNYIYEVTFLFSNLFKEASNNTGRLFADYTSFQKFLILQVLGVPCAVLDILRSHSITKKFSLNKLCTT